MFLFDEGGPEQLPSLKSHANDPAYESNFKLRWQFLELKMVMRH